MTRLSIQSALSMTALSMIFAAATGAAIIALFLSSKPVVILILCSFVGAVALYFSGNPRLFFLWGMIVSAPFNLGKDFVVVPHMGGAGAYSIELVDLFIAPMLLFLFRDLLRGYRKHVRFSWITFYCAGMIGLGLLTMALGPFRNIAGHEVARMVKCLVLFLILINELVRPMQFMHVVGAFTMSVTVQGIAALFQYLFKINLGLQVLGEADEESILSTSEATYRGAADAFRVGAFLGHSNLLAAFMALLLPICIAVMLSRARMVYKVAIAGATLVGGAALLVTLSRTGWIAFGVAFVALLGLSFLHPRLRRRYLITRVAMIGMILVLAAAFSGPIIMRFTRSDPGAVTFRYEWMGVAWSMVKERPLLGHGLNSFVFNMAPFTRYGSPLGLTEKFGENWPVVHNIYLLVWSEQGTVGFAFFVGLHLHVLWLAYQNLRKYRSDLLFSVNLGCICGFVAIMLDGMASFFIRNPACGRVFWIVVALIVAIHYWNREHPSPSPAEGMVGGEVAARIVA